METTNVLLLASIFLNVILLFCCRIMNKEKNLHYSNYYTSRMDVIDLEDECSKLRNVLNSEIELRINSELKYRRLTELSVTQTAILNDKNGVKKH